MAKLPPYVAIISVMISGCIGMDRVPERWSKALDKELSDIFYKFYPQNQHFWEKVKQDWDRHHPGYDNLSVDELSKYACGFKFRYLKKWREHPDAEREQVEDTLAYIYYHTDKTQPGHEKRMLDMFLQFCPRYKHEPEVIRTVVYNWYERYAPLGKEISAKVVDWTSARNAFLRHAVQRAEENEVAKMRRTKELWNEKYRYLNVKAKSLWRHAVNFMKAEERQSKEQGKRTTWDDDKKAALSYIHYNIRKMNVNNIAAIKDRWDRMQGNQTRLSGHALLNRANELLSANFIPKSKSLQKAIEEYERLPPIPKEIFSKPAMYRSERQLRIREGEEPYEEHEDEPTSPNVDFTPEILAHPDQDMAEIHAPYAGHNYYPHQTDYHGSSSHTPIDQGHFTSLLGTPHLHGYSWYPDSSSSQNPMQQNPFGLQPEISHPHGHFSGPDSSHTTIHEDPSGLITVTLRQRRRQTDHRGSSNQTSVQSDSSGLPANIHNPYEHFSSPGSSSSHTSIQEYPSAYLAVTPRPRSRQPHHSGSSSNTSLHQDSSRLQTDTPRPQRHLGFPGRDSRH